MALSRPAPALSRHILSRGWLGPPHEIFGPLAWQTTHVRGTDRLMLKGMRFSGVWRDYQKRVLDEFEAHISDQRVHIVAAPGSGKTVLGLELMRRLGRPALILAPTRTIRDQWPERLVPLFMAAPPDGGCVSRDPTLPGPLTVATYQALHALWSDERNERFPRMLEAQRAHGPITLILDEAHHLRREWWSALQALIDALPNAKLVVLTATPPYDAPYAEWARYEALCGPVDLEIGIPELVRHGDLSPHQDHVLFSRPGQEALRLLERRRRGLAAIRASLLEDEGLLEFFEVHPWLTDPAKHTEDILEAPEMLSAIISHLASAGRRLPSVPLALLGIRQSETPPPSIFWLQVLLDGLLFRLTDTFPIGKERTDRLRANLHEFGLIEGGKVKLVESRRLFSLMAGDLAKLDSIAAIARAEAIQLGKDLRMVILSDHVRGGELSRVTKQDYKPAKLGVVPIFETLRRAAVDEALQDQSIAVLTGSLVILPKALKRVLNNRAIARGLAPEDLVLADLPGCPSHGHLRAAGEAAGRLVELLTALFLAGDIRILIGTQALLGEGWDAPAINSLVLASNSAAFMLSNQMRGRAIRIDPMKSDKVANIWHLATVEELPSHPLEELGQRLNWGILDQGGNFTSDYQLLERRFRAFEGISNWGPPVIESGIARLGLGGAGGLEAANARMMNVAADRPAIAERWRYSLGEANPRSHAREIVSPEYAPRRLSWGDTLRWLTVGAVSSGALAAADQLRGVEGLAGIGAVGMAAAGAATLATLPKLFKAGRLAIRNGSLEGSLAQASAAVLQGLNVAGVLSDVEHQSATVDVRRGMSGRNDIVLHGVSRTSEHAIAVAVTELLGPVQNPRYLLVRRSWLGPWGRVDYHAVPNAIGQRKEWAEAFQRAWRLHVGVSDLVFTRTAEGRLELLRARARSFAAGFQRRVDRRSVWL